VPLTETERVDLRRARWAGRWAAIAVAGVLIIEAFSAAGGGLLDQFAAEYAGGGSRNWRTAQGRAFQNLLIGVLLLEVAATGLGCAHALRWFHLGLPARRRALVGLCLATLLACNAWLLHRGVWSAAFGG
jgi:hypothetical protein